MKAINVYLTFDGNCREAMEFYKKCFGGELYMMRFSEAPADLKLPKESKDRIIHAKLTAGSAVLMASDTMPGMEFQHGNNFSVYVDCESEQEIKKLFAAVGKSGKVTMPLQDTFWGAYFGVLTDRFGISWMFSLEKPR
jgi:PhnB protein